MSDRCDRSVFGRRLLAGVAVLATLGSAASALARTSAPQPVRPVSSELYTGRWYEVARTPNTMQKDCEGATTDFAGWTDGGAFVAVETCHKGSPDGPAKTVRIKAKVLRAGDYTKFRMSFLGGIVRQEYWIIDHADDNSWAIMGTPGGNYVWLLSRKPSLPAPVLAGALSRMDALGYPRGHLVYPAQGGAMAGRLTANTP
jgi:apolipoprotein D and lipocalin family protein